MSDLLIFGRNIEACRTLRGPIYIGYFPLNKRSSLEKQHIVTESCVPLMLIRIEKERRG
jgi:5,10-methylenetetrahydrofolate reductase